ncbi:hypothetical protein VNO77_41934 [Canavalia gladiata]|uniref:non-specific serine/threonine protein kinase n=1 Tax=Canavalia gladiata TaxID=3824 RepID=A0AAN9K2C9_CANGL
MDMSLCILLCLILQHLTFFLLLQTSTAFTDPKFEACVPKTCGNGLSISYPFYIHGIQQPFCGYPGFGLTCGNNGFPILNLTNTQYTIHEISYNNESLRVSNPSFSNSNTSACIAPTQNLTVGKYSFQFGSNQRDLLVFYGCNLASLPEEMQQHRLGCYAGNETASVVGLYREDLEFLRLARDNCKGGVVSAKVEDVKEGVQQALNKGFVLNWNATNCTECASSGGRCGFDSDFYSFRCYCIDRVHSAKCPTDGGGMLEAKSTTYTQQLLKNGA